MKWSQYDLDLREWCIQHGKPIPGKPEAEYGINWNQPVFNGIHFTGPRDFKLWGKNKQVAHHVDDFETAEEYWNAVRKTAAENLDKLRDELRIENSI